MPFLSSISDWLKQSDQLIRAYPTSTRITTKYAIAPPSAKSRKRKRNPPTTSSTTTDPSTAGDTNDATAAPRATLILKTYDPVSGACLKYKTDQAAEANRLVRSLSALGSSMAGLDVDVEGVLDAVPAGEQQSTVAAAATGTEAKGSAKEGGDVKGEGAAGGEGQGGGKRKKKKGKK